MPSTPDSDGRPWLRYLTQQLPWPAYSGGALRDAGLLRELARQYRVELVALTRRPAAQTAVDLPEGVVARLVLLPAADRSLAGRLALLPLMLQRGLPYHSALTLRSLAAAGWVVRLQRERMPVMTGSGAWGGPAPTPATHWILNQTDADIDFWRVYRQHSRGLRRVAAWLNEQLAARHFPPLYRRVGQIISVCDEDRQLTQRYAPQVPIEVIANGVDCTQPAPQRSARRADAAPLLLFSGSSAERNVVALEQFIATVWPLIRAARPTAQLRVAGDWQPAAQRRLHGTAGLSFSGRQADLRPEFARADVYVAPFHDSYGSKLKVAEALAMAMPIVATTAALRGFGLQHNVQVCIADDAADFAAQCLGLLDDPARAARIAAQARRYAETYLDWAILGRRLRALVERVRTPAIDA